MTRTPRLHIPHPPARPGDTPDFSYVDISPAGAVPRPDVTTRLRDIERSLAFEMVRVLDDEHAAVGPWDPHLEHHDLQVGLRYILLTRLFDERMHRMQRQGKISFYMKSLGEEAVSVAASHGARAWRHAVSFLPQPGPADSARGTESRGSHVPAAVQHPGHVQGPADAGHVPLGAGQHLLDLRAISRPSIRTRWVGRWRRPSRAKTHLAAAWIGDGSSAEADFHHAMTFASVYLAPVVLNIVNNQWAISRPFRVLPAASGARSRPADQGYGIPGVRVDGNDLLAVYAVTRWAAERARQRRGVRP